MDIGNVADSRLFTIANSHKYALFWLMAIASCLIFVGVGLRDPWPADEPRFALIAKEMVDTGRWFFPARGQELYPDKPPVFMWTMAIFYWLFGSIKVAFLIPSALSGLLTVFLVYDISRKLWSTQTGFIAGLLVIFCVQFMLQAKTAQIDAMVCALITAGCYGLLRFILFDGKWRWYFMAWFFMGLGVITKGVGFLPLLMLLPYGGLKIVVKQDHQTQNMRHGWRFLLGPIVMLFAISLWFLPMLWLVEQSQNPVYALYRDNILFKQTVTRYADAWHHIKPFWYYIIAVIPVFWLPLSLMLPWLVKPWWQACKQADARIILPLGWVVLVLVFFSFSPGKRGVYILPALPMLALITAPYVSNLLKNKGVNWLIWAVVTSLSLLFFMFALAGFNDAKFALKLSEKYAVEPWLFLLFLGSLGLLVSAVALRLSKWQTWPVFISVVWLTYSTWGYTLLQEVKTPKNIYREISKQVAPNAEIALVDFSEQFLLFSKYRMTHFGYHTDNQQQIAAAWAWQQGFSNRYVLMNYQLISACFDQQKAIHVGFAHRVDWVLLDTKSRLDSCEQIDNNITSYQYGY